MIDLDSQKEHFKNHVAKFADYGNIKILDFAEPDTNHYRIRFLFEEDHYKLHISGDLGHLIASNYRNMTWSGFSDYVNNTGYFAEKIDCADRPLYVYDEDEAAKELKDIITDYIDEDSLGDSSNIEEQIQSILKGFSPDSGISESGADMLLQIDSDSWEYVNNIGKQQTGILDLYMLAFKLAKEQLGDKESDAA